jgi:anti-sigma factor RsiW
MRIPGRPPRATESDLVRLADGTLKPRRRKVVEEVVATSGELQARLREQRRAVDAVRGVTGERDRRRAAR